MHIDPAVFVNIVYMSWKETAVKAPRTWGGKTATVEQHQRPSLYTTRRSVNSEKHTCIYMSALNSDILWQTSGV